MKFAAIALALGVAVLATPTVYAQVYVNEGFVNTSAAAAFSNNYSGWSSTAASGNALWLATGGSNGVASVTGTSNTNSTYSLSKTFSVDTNRIGAVEFNWTVSDNIGQGANATPLNFSVTLSGLANPLFTYTSSLGTSGRFAQSTPVSLATGVTYTLTFQASKLTAGDVITVDNVLVYQVPGPLPVLGAFAAFGWSRRLRAKIREAQA